MRRRFAVVLSLVLVGMMVSTALAQSSGGGGSGGGVTVGSMFKMFFAPIPENPRAVDWFGVFLIWLILCQSIVVVALIVKYALANRRDQLIPESTRLQLEQMLQEKHYREAIEFANSDPSYLGKLVSAALGEAANGYGAMERAIEETGDGETTKMLRPLEYLNINGNIGPMLGLFGTVYGIIIAFNDLLLAGGKPDPAKLAGGISTALVTTFWGLVVAMPALGAYALLRNKVDSQTVEGMVVAGDLISPLKPGGSKKHAAGGDAKRPATPKPVDAEPV